MNKLKSGIEEIMILIGLIVLPCDLLYLYFNGGWQEPNMVIAVAELIILMLLPIFGFGHFVRFISNWSKKR